MKINQRHLGWIILTLFFAMLCSVNAMAKPKNDANGSRALMREAASAYENEEFDLALTKYNEAYAIEPNSAILYNMGRVCESKADYQGAIAYYKQFLTASGSDEDARVDAIDRIKNINETLSILNSGTPAQVVNNAPAQAPVATAAPVAVAPSGSCVDINTASLKDLERLNGVGPATATKIADARPYRSIDDLNKVKGIGPKKIDKMRNQICPIGSTTTVNTPSKPAPVKAAPLKTTPAPVKTPAPSSGVVDI